MLPLDVERQVLAHYTERRQWRCLTCSSSVHASALPLIAAQCNGVHPCKSAHNLQHGFVPPVKTLDVNFLPGSAPGCAHCAHHRSGHRCSVSCRSVRRALRRASCVPPLRPAGSRAHPWPGAGGGGQHSICTLAFQLFGLFPSAIGFLCTSLSAGSSGDSVSRALVYTLAQRVVHSVFYL